MNYAPAFVASGSPSPAARRDKAMRLYLLRSLLSPIVSTRWARFIRRYHGAFEAGPPPARVLLKPVRSYIHARLGPAGRLRRLARSLPTVSPALFATSACGASAPASRSSSPRSRGERGASTAWRSPPRPAFRCSARGSWRSFSSNAASRSRSAKLSLAFAHVEGRLAVLIGGLQGPPVGHKREVIDATRELRGLRPKDATLLAARAFARAIGADSFSPSPIATTSWTVWAKRRSMRTMTPIGASAAPLPAGRSASCSRRSASSPPAATAAPR